MRTIKTAIIIVCLSFCGPAHSQDSSFVNLMKFIKGKDAIVDAVLSNPTNYRTQFIYTSFRVDDSENVEFNTIAQSSDAYFYPASLVKLPIALITLEKLNQLGLNVNCRLKIKNDKNCGNQKYIELSKNSDLTFKQMLEEMLVVSDNNYFNALYHFITPAEINERLRELGFENTKVYKCFTGCKQEDQLFCHSLSVVNELGEVVYKQDASELAVEELEKYYTYDEQKLIGDKHEAYFKIVDAPFDFNYNLEFPLKDLHDMMLRLAFPDTYSVNLRWKIDEAQRSNVLQLMSLFPDELNELKFKNSKNYPYNKYKYIYFGENKKSDTLRTIGKIGISHGFTSESAFVLNMKTGSCFLLSISLYTNANKIVNDGNYEYETVAKPFISRMSELLSDYHEKTELMVDFTDKYFVLPE